MLKSTIQNRGSSDRQLTFEGKYEGIVAVGFIKEKDSPPLYLQCDPDELSAAVEAAVKVAKAFKKK